MTPRRRKPLKHQVVLDDPRAIKALAHPARLAAVDELFAGGELTATECARIVGLSPSAMSYHLRTLERLGMIERVESSEDGRERPWRAKGTSIAVNSTTSRLGLAATTTLATTVVDRVRGELGAWMARGEDEDPAWREASGVSNARLWITLDEAAEIEAAVTAIVDRLRGRTPDDHPDGARRVRFSVLLFPVDENPG